MAINVDTSKPLTEDQIAELRTRLPESLVQHYVRLANEAQPEPAPEPEKAPAKPAARASAKKDEDILK